MSEKNLANEISKGGYQVTNEVSKENFPVVPGITPGIPMIVEIVDEILEKGKIVFATETIASMGCRMANIWDFFDFRSNHPNVEVNGLLVLGEGEYNLVIQKISGGQYLLNGDHRNNRSWNCASSAGGYVIRAGKFLVVKPVS